MSLTGPITEFRNTQAFRYAANALKAGNKVVGIIMMGDSNCVNGGVGFHDGFIRALDTLGYKAYSTGTWGGFINKGANYSQGHWYGPISIGSGLIWSGLTNGMTSGATQQRGQITASNFPNGLSAYCNGPWNEPEGETSGWNATEGIWWGSGTTYSTGSAVAGIRFKNTNDLKGTLTTTGAFRSFHWFVKGPSTGRYQFGARNENGGAAYDSGQAFNYNAVTTPSTAAFATTGDTYSLTYAALDYPASASRVQAVDCLQVKNNTDMTGAGCVLFTAVAAGATALSGGYFVSPGIMYSGASLRQMLNQTVPGAYGGATTITNTWLDSYLQAQIDLIRSNDQAGGSTAGALVFWINSGRNDRNDTSGSFDPVTFTYNAAGASSCSAAGFKNNVSALINRIMARPPIQSFYNGSNVCFLVAPSQRLTATLWAANSAQYNTVAGLAAPEGGNTAMQGFKDAAWDLAAESPYPVTAVDINELASTYEWPFLYAGAGSADHLHAAYGYSLVSMRLWNKLLQCAYSLTGVTSSPWGSTPDQASKPIWLNRDDRDACRATNNGWEIPIDGLTGTQYEVIVTSRGLADREAQSADRTAPVVLTPFQDQFGGTTYDGTYSNSLGAISYLTGDFACKLRLGNLLRDPRYESFTSGGGGATTTAISATFGPNAPSWLRIQAHQTIWNCVSITGFTSGLSGTVSTGTRLPVDILLTHPNGVTGIFRTYITTTV